MAESETKWVSLGDYIEQCCERNTDGLYGADCAIGVNIDKEIRKMRGSVDCDKINTFWIVRPGYFVFNPRGSRKLGLGYNDSKETFITTFNNIIFRVKTESNKHLDSLFLFMYLSRKEWDRNAEYLSWGSSTEVFSWNTLCNVLIPLPSIEKQRVIVAEWKGLREMKEQNEQIAQPLMELCQSYIEEGKKRYPVLPLCDYIEQSDLRNNQIGLSAESVRGISVEKKIISTKADMTNVSVASYKIFAPDEFCFVTVTSRNGDRISVSINNTEERFIVSSTYEVFRIKDKNKLLPSYLSLWFSRPEFDRYARFNSWGSARESFSFDEMCRVQIPLPPIEVQQAIVNIYKSAQEAKKIAAEADKLSNEICPALIQHVIHS